MLSFFKTRSLFDVLFYAAILLNAIPVLYLKFFPTLDGAAHLYNSNIIGHLLFNDKTVIHDFYCLNTFPVPNWTSHFIIGIVNLFSPAYIAEKIFLIIYFIGFPLSFNYFIKTVSPENTRLSFFIFPFCYSFLFYMGFYNFCFSFIPLFLSLAYYFRENGDINKKNVFPFFLLISFVYFTHAVVFGFLLMVVLLSALMKTSFPDSNQKGFNFIKGIIQQNIWLILSILPFILLYAGFFSFRSVNILGARYPLKTLSTWLFECKPLITLIYETDRVYTSFIFFITLIIFLFAIYDRILKLKQTDIVAKKWHSNLLKPTDSLFFISLVVLLLYFMVPDRAFAGMMTDRLCLLFYIFFILWLVLQHIPRWASFASLILIIYIQFNLVKDRYKINEDLSKNANEFYNLSSYIDDGSVILPVNYSDYYIMNHFSNYLGADKHVIILENVEASVGWYPVEWNIDSIPVVLLGNHADFPHVFFPASLQKTIQKHIDYVLIWGNLQKLNSSEEKYFHEILSDDFTPIYTNTVNTVRLYRYNKKQNL